MSNETYWAIKRREWASRQARATRRPRNTRRSVPLRGPRPPSAPIPAEVIEETAADIVVGPDGFDNDTYQIVDNNAPAEPSYRDLQAQAKELDIKANQPADKLKKEIEKKA